MVWYARMRRDFFLKRKYGIEEETGQAFRLMSSSKRQTEALAANRSHTLNRDEDNDNNNGVRCHRCLDIVVCMYILLLHYRGFRTL